MKFPRTTALVDLLMDWTPDARTLRRILVETPERLFAD